MALKNVLQDRKLTTRELDISQLADTAYNLQRESALNLLHPLKLQKLNYSLIQNTDTNFNPRDNNLGRTYDEYIRLRLEQALALAKEAARLRWDNLRALAGNPKPAEALIGSSIYDDYDQLGRDAYANYLAQAGTYLKDNTNTGADRVWGWLFGNSVGKSGSGAYDTDALAPLGYAIAGNPRLVTIIPKDPAHVYGEDNTSDYSLLQVANDFANLKSLTFDQYLESRGVENTPLNKSEYIKDYEDYLANQALVNGATTVDGFLNTTAFSPHVMDRTKAGSTNDNVATPKAYNKTLTSVVDDLFKADIPGAAKDLGITEPELRQALYNSIALWLNGNNPADQKEQLQLLGINGLLTVAQNSQDYTGTANYYGTDRFRSWLEHNAADGGLGYYSNPEEYRNALINKLLPYSNLNWNQPISDLDNQTYNKLVSMAGQAAQSAQQFRYATEGKVDFKSALEFSKDADLMKKYNGDYNEYLFRLYLKNYLESPSVNQETGQYTGSKTYNDSVAKEWFSSPDNIKGFEQMDNETGLPWSDFFSKLAENPLGKVDSPKDLLKWIKFDMDNGKDPLQILKELYDLFGFAYPDNWTPSQSPTNPVNPTTPASGTGSGGAGGAGGTGVPAGSGGISGSYSTTGGDAAFYKAGQFGNIWNLGAVNQNQYDYFKSEANDYLQRALDSLNLNASNLLNNVMNQQSNLLAQQLLQLLQTRRANDYSALTSGANKGAQLAALNQAQLGIDQQQSAAQQTAINEFLGKYLEYANQLSSTQKDIPSTMLAADQAYQQILGNAIAYELYGEQAAQMTAAALIEAARLAAQGLMGAANITANGNTASSKPTALEVLLGAAESR